MAKLFRPKIVRYLTPDGKRVPKGTDGARRVEECGDRWYGQYRDANDVWKRVPLSTDKTAAEFMLSELKRKAERERAGTWPAARFTPKRRKGWRAIRRLP